jgi:hypothetical protein
MRRTATLLTLVAGAVLTIGLAAQAPPNLSGMWRIPSSVPLVGHPPELTITQTTDTVTMRMPNRQPETLTFRLDGQESRNQSAGPGAPVETVSRAAWEGAKLVITTTTTMAGGPIASRQVYSLSGDQLVVESSNVGPGGSPASVGSRTSTYGRYQPVPLPAPPVRSVEAGFTSLFNGQDLAGWKVGGPAAAFTVAGGAIVATGVAGAPCGCAHLFYDGAVGNHMFRNFDLKLDIAARYRANGGVYVMTEFQEKGFPAKGFEIQVNNTHSDHIRSGSLYHVVDLSYTPAADDEWYPMEIVANGDTITITLKGREVVRWVQPSDWPGTYDSVGRRIAPGTIAFQAHDPTSTTAYANIRIKQLN